MIWSVAANAYRQKRLRSHQDESMEFARRSYAIVERSAEVREHQVQLLEDILQRQEEILKIIKTFNLNEN